MTPPATARGPARRARRALLPVVALFSAMLAAAPAHAHGRSVSHSTWQLDASGASVEARFTALDLTALQLPEKDADGGDPVARYAAAHLVLERDGKPCALATEPHAVDAPPGWRVFDWRLSCPAGGRAIRSSVLLDELPSHLHFARATGADGRTIEHVFAEGDGAWPVDGAAGAGSGRSFAACVLLGVLYILCGWDHLAFVAALLLLARELREAVLLVTAFTLAHSLTLVLAALGALQPDVAAVGALIGFSIALVAAENAWLLADRGRLVPGVVATLLAGMAALAAYGVGVLRPLALLGLALFALCHFALLDRSPRPARLRAAVAFGFGLVHGLGFAAALARSAAPGSEPVPALVGFNVGIELGQLALVALFWPLLRLLERRRDRRLGPLVVETGSAALCGLGLFWFLTRALG